MDCKKKNHILRKLLFIESSFFFVNENTCYKNVDY
jgi:hypothetical protein